MAHLGARAFDAISGEVVQATATILFNKHVEMLVVRYVRLTDLIGEAAKSAALKGAVLEF